MSRTLIGLVTDVRGSANIAINEWTNYHSVRSRSVEILAGQEVRIIVEPTVKITTTEKFRSLNIEDRKCKLAEENEVGFF